EHIDVLNHMGNSALRRAVTTLQADMVELLVRRGANVQMVNTNNQTALQVAADRACPEAIDALLRSPSTDMDAADDRGLTVLHHTTASDNEFSAKVLMHHGADMTRRTERLCPTHKTAESASSSEITRVNSEEADKAKRDEMQNYESQHRNLSLHTAISRGEIEAVQHCLERGAGIASLQGADIDTLDASGRSPLLLATANKSWGSVNALLARPADTTIRDKEKRTILHLIIQNGGKPSLICVDCCHEKIRLLLNEQDAVGNTPLHYASVEGQPSVIRSLLSLGARLNVKNNSRQSPLHLAAKNGHYKTCQRLLDSAHGQHIVNEQDGHGFTPVHSAALNGHCRIVELFLRHGACFSKDWIVERKLHFYSATDNIILACGREAVRPTDGAWLKPITTIWSARHIQYNATATCTKQ
ncbi:hypothetical protein LSAT2_021078, partial [Lamellibrachia satsuma]